MDNGVIGVPGRHVLKPVVVEPNIGLDLSQWLKKMEELALAKLEKKEVAIFKIVQVRVSFMWSKYLDTILKNMV